MMIINSDGDAGPYLGHVETEGEAVLDEGEVVPVTAPVQATTISVDEIAQFRVAQLKAALSARNLSVRGRKQELHDRLREAIVSGAPLATNMTTDQMENMAGEGFRLTAHWEYVEANDDDVVNEEGLARGPTTPEGEDSTLGPVKKNYAEHFDRPPFVQQVTLPRKNVRGNLIYDLKGKVKYEIRDSSETVPNIPFLHQNGLNTESHPFEWFNLFMPIKRTRQMHPDMVSMADLTTWSNKKAYLCNAGEGGTQYSDWTKVTVDEVMAFHGLYMHNGLSPLPQVEKKFEHPKKNEVNGSNICHEVFGQNANRRLREFKAFFAAVDPTQAVPPRATHPNYKVHRMFKHAIYISKAAIYIGRHISADEQTIGCQGRHPDILRITYKQEGDGFQCDAVCSDSYTYSFYFRNQKAPDTFVNMGMLPLHARVHALFDQLPCKYYQCALDNLYMSAKLCRSVFDLFIFFTHFFLTYQCNGLIYRSCWRSKQRIMIYGVTRKSGRGIPKCILQEEVSTKEDLARTRGTVKVAKLVGDDCIQGLIAVSLYDTKPVYIMTNAIKKVKWIKKDRELYDKSQNKKLLPHFIV